MRRRLEDHTEFKLPVVLLAGRPEDDVVAGAGDRGGESDEHERVGLRLSLDRVEREGAQLLVAARVARIAERALHDLLHVHAVVRSGAQDLAHRLHRREYLQVVERGPARERRGDLDERVDRGVPILEEAADGGVRSKEGARVVDETIAQHADERLTGGGEGPETEGFGGDRGGRRWGSLVPRSSLN